VYPEPVNLHPGITHTTNGTNLKENHPCPHPHTWRVPVKPAVALMVPTARIVQEPGKVSSTEGPTCTSTRCHLKDSVPSKLGSPGRRIWANEVSNIDSDVANSGGDLASTMSCRLGSSALRRLLMRLCRAGANPFRARFEAPP
jgi:hypothetical protein